MPLLAEAAKRGGGGRGTMVVTSSCASMHNVTNVDLSSYAASKAATDHLVRLLAAKFARWYIRVNGINPGCKCLSYPPFEFMHWRCRARAIETSRELTRRFAVVVPSNMNPVGAEGNMFASLFDKVPAKRAGNEEDIAGAVMYLASRAGVSLCL